MLKKILAIDPGGTTGFSSNVTEEPFWQVKFENNSEFRVYLLDFIHYDVWVPEGFYFRQKAKVETSAIEQLTIVCEIANEHEIELVIQNPSVKSSKGFWDDKKLKYLGLYRVRNADTKHGIDALRHRLHYEERNGMFDLNKLKGLPIKDKTDY